MERFARLFEVDDSQLLVTVEPEGRGADIKITTKIDDNLITITLNTMPLELAMISLDEIDDTDALKKINQIRDIYNKAMI